MLVHYFPIGFEYTLGPLAEAQSDGCLRANVEKALADQSKRMLYGAWGDYLDIEDVDQFPCCADGLGFSRGRHKARIFNSDQIADWGT